MRKLLFLLVFVLTILSAKAQWTLIVTTRVDNCSSMFDETKALLESAHIDQEYNNSTYNNRSDCESARNRVYSIAQGARCLTIVQCSCSGMDMENGNTNSTNTLGPSQGTSFTPSNPADQVKQWTEDFLKKYEMYIAQNPNYTMDDFAKYFNHDDFEKYINEEYDLQVNNYSFSDRNQMKKSDDSITGYRDVDSESNPSEKSFDDETDLESTDGYQDSDVVEENVPKKTEYDEYGRPIFKGIKNENFLPELEMSEDLYEHHSNYDKIELEDESKSTLGSMVGKVAAMVDKVSDKLEEWGVKEHTEDFLSDRVENLAEAEIAMVCDIPGVYSNMWGGAKTAVGTGVMILEFAESTMNNILRAADTFDYQELNRNQNKAQVKLGISIISNLLPW